MGSVYTRFGASGRGLAYIRTRGSRGNTALVLTSAITAFFLVAFSTMAGVLRIDPVLLEAGRNYGAAAGGCLSRCCCREPSRSSSPACGWRWGYLLDLSLKHANLSIKDVQMATMGFPDMVKALETGAIAGGILSQPFAAQADMKKVAFSPLRDVKSPHIPVTVIFYNTDWATKNPELATAVMAGYIQAIRDINKLGKHEGEYLQGRRQRISLAKYKINPSIME